MERIKSERYSFSGNVDLSEVSIKVSQTEPALRRLFLASDGRLWVQTSWGDHDLPDGVLARYDILTPDGRLEKELDLACPGADRDRDQWFLLDGRHILVAEGGDAAWSAFQRSTGAMRVGDDEEDIDEDDDAVELAAVLYRIAE
jgi:hypothetical protein